MTNALLYLTSLVLAAMRIAGVKHAAFQAAAHLFVGGLITAWWIGRESRSAWWWSNQTCIYLALVVGLSLVEVGCALFFFLAK